MSRFDRTPQKTERAKQLRREVSKTEYRLWPYLRAKQMGVSFRRQHPMGPYFLDYYCASLKLVIEVDGDLHDAARDAARDQFLAAKGIHVLRIYASDMDESVEAVAARIRAVVFELREQ